MRSGFSGSSDRGSARWMPNAPGSHAPRGTSPSAWPRVTLKRTRPVSASEMRRVEGVSPSPVAPDRSSTPSPAHARARRRPAFRGPAVATGTSIWRSAIACARTLHARPALASTSPPAAVCVSPRGAWLPRSGAAARRRVSVPQAPRTPAPARGSRPTTRTPAAAAGRAGATTGPRGFAPCSCPAPDGSPRSRCAPRGTPGRCARPRPCPSPR